MVIAVNTRLIVKDKFCGISWFAYESLKRITKNHPEHKFLFLFDRPYSEEYIFSSNVTPIVVGPPTRHPLLWHWWFQFSVAKVLRQHKPDLFLSPDGFLPLKASMKTISVIHDVGFEHYDENLPTWPRKYYRKHFPLFAKKASRIATVSNFSKQDIIKTYNISSDKIDVVYDGANDAYKPISEAEKKEVRQKYAEGNEYFIAVGRLHPRKNTHLLLQSFDEFKKDCPSSLKLVIVGNPNWQTKEMKEIYDKMCFQKDVIFTGRIGTDELKKIMGAALSLVFLPFYEGFGLPLIEAMNCDVPIISIDSTSMPEIAGDAALFTNPSINSIKEAMASVYKDLSLRNNLIEKGKKQREFFSWDKTAENLWQCIEKTFKM